MRYCFDIDGVICETLDGDYENATPIRKNIDVINLLSIGHEIILFTARGSVTKLDWTELTELQMRKWDVKYNKLYMGKPHADVYIDDKGISSLDFFHDR